MPEANNSRKTGQLLVEEGLVRQEDVERALAIQAKAKNAISRTRARLIGMILCDLNLVTPIDIYCVLEAHGKLLSLETFLIEKGLVSQSTVEAVKSRAKETGTPFLSLMAEEGAISKPELQQIVFDLFHIPFRSISDIVFDANLRLDLTAVIPESLAKEHLVIPLVIKSQTLLCGITDPDNLLLIQKLNTQFPQYRFKTLFIPFSGFTWFYKLLYEKSWVTRNPPEKSVDLSLLLKFCLKVTDPVADHRGIESLYNRYELVRNLTGRPAKGNRLALFKEFILESHKRIVRETGCKGVDYCLDNTGKRLRVVAFPRNEDA